MYNQPLVSVGVLTYNSANTVIETLDSIYSQTYINIELIISDDYSSDDTVERCKEWINAHSKRFVQSKILTTSNNTGIAGNCNRMLSNLTGQWIKIIAADDILLPTCIEDCITYIQRNPKIKWIVGKTKKYINEFKVENLVKEDTLYTPKRLAILNGSLETQKKAILDFTFIEAPAMFIKIDIIHEVGGYNETYPLIEDWPMNKKLLEAGYKCYFLNKDLVGYRKSDSSVFNTLSKLFNIRFIKSIYLFKKNELFEHHGKAYHINITLHYYLCKFIQAVGMNNTKKYNRYFYSVCNRIIDFLF